MSRSIPFDNFLFQYLKDTERALGYLNEVLSNYKDNDKESQEELLLCLRSIAHAQGGMSNLAKKTGLGRESLYKTLSETGNPRLGSLTKIIEALFDFEVEVKIMRKNKPKAVALTCNCATIYSTV